MMDFDSECEKFLQIHRSRRSGSRLKRIEKGLGHSEMLFLRSVWWPLFHDFQNLHPEYEVRDYKEGTRYIDFAYVQPYLRIAIEIDGFGPHWRDITRWQFSEHNIRQNVLAIDGWNVLRFSYEVVQDQPRLCQQTIQQSMAAWQVNALYLETLTLKEREVIRLAIRSPQSITPKDAALVLQMSLKHTREILHQLVEKGWLVPASGNVRYTSYRLHPSRSNVRL